MSACRWPAHRWPILTASAASPRRGSRGEPGPTFSWLRHFVSLLTRRRWIPYDPVPLLSWNGRRQQLLARMLIAWEIVQTLLRITRSDVQSNEENVQDKQDEQDYEGGERGQRGVLMASLPVRITIV